MVKNKTTVAVLTELLEKAKIDKHAKQVGRVS